MNLPAVEIQSFCTSRIHDRYRRCPPIYQGFSVFPSCGKCRWCRRAASPPAGARGVLATSPPTSPPQVAKRGIQENRKALPIYQGFGVYPNCLFCRLRRQRRKRGCEGTSRSGRRAGRPPAPPAFPVFRVNSKALQIRGRSLRRSTIRQLKAEWSHIHAPL